MRSPQRGPCILATVQLERKFSNFFLERSEVVLLSSLEKYSRQFELVCKHFSLRQNLKRAKELEKNRHKVRA
jgi:hypothetical protein